MPKSSRTFLSLLLSWTRILLIISSLWICISTYATDTECELDCQKFSAWASITDAEVPVTAINGFPALLESAIETLNHQYDPQKRFDFLDLVDRRKFVWFRKSVGWLKATRIDGQVILRFVPVARVSDIKNSPGYPLAVVIKNLPLRCNEGQDISNPIGDSSTHLMRFLAKIQVKKKRSVLLVDARQESLTKENSVFEKRSSVPWDLKKRLISWKRATIQRPQLSDWVFGPTSSSIQGAIALGISYWKFKLLLSHSPGTEFDFRPAIAAGIFSLVLCTFMDTYLNFVERGHEELRRFMVGMFLSVPTWGMEHGWESFSPLHSDWQSAGYTYLVIFGWGYLNRKASKHMNELPKAYDSLRLYQERYPVLGLAPVAEALKLDPKEAGVKKTKVWRETMALERLALSMVIFLISPELGLPALVSLGIGHKLYGHYKLEQLLEEETAARKEKLDREISKRQSSTSPDSNLEAKTSIEPTAQIENGKIENGPKIKSPEEEHFDILKIRVEENKRWREKIIDGRTVDRRFLGIHWKFSVPGLKIMPGLKWSLGKISPFRRFQSSKQSGCEMLLSSIVGGKEPHLLQQTKVDSSQQDSPSSP